MQISPRRRQRALKVHELRQQGRSLRNIGKLLNISHATALADLKLIETHWSEITRQSADDFLLEQFSLLQRRLRNLLRRDLVKEFGHLNPTAFVRFYEAHNHELAVVLRETRRLAAQLHERAELREIEPGQLPLEIDFPEDELTAAPKPARPAQPAQPAQPAKPTQPAQSTKQNKSAKSVKSVKPRQQTNIHHGLPKSSKPNHSNRPIPRKTLDLPTPDAPQKILDQPLEQQLADLSPEELFRLAETHIEQLQRQEIQSAAAG